MPSELFSLNHQYFEKLAKNMYRAPSTEHSLLTPNLAFKVILKGFFKRFMKIHSNPVIHQYYTMALRLNLSMKTEFKFHNSRCFSFHIFFKWFEIYWLMAHFYDILALTQLNLYLRWSISGSTARRKKEEKQKDSALIDITCTHLMLTLQTEKRTCFLY